MPLRSEAAKNQKWSVVRCLKHRVRFHSETDALSGQLVVELNNAFRLNMSYKLDFAKKS